MKSLYYFDTPDQQLEKRFLMPILKVLLDSLGLLLLQEV